MVGALVIVLLVLGVWGLYRLTERSPAAEPVADARPDPSPSQQSPPAAEPRELSFRLIGTTVSEDEPERNRAAIVDRILKRRQLVALGDRILSYDDIFVGAIEPMRVRLDVGGQPLWLELDLETAVVEEDFLNPIEWWTEEADLDPETLTEEQMRDLMIVGVERFLRRILGRREQDLQLLQAKFAPWEVEGEPVGVLASSIAPGGIYDQLGLQQGDVLMEINSWDVRTPEDTLRVMELVEQQKEIRLTIRRYQEERIVTIQSHIPLQEPTTWDKPQEDDWPQGAG